MLRGRLAARRVTIGRVGSVRPFDRFNMRNHSTTIGYAFIAAEKNEHRIFLVDFQTERDDTKKNNVDRFWKLPELRSRQCA